MQSLNYDPADTCLHFAIDHTTSQARSPGDPNDLNGPAGYGAANFVTPTGNFPYQIEFENEPSANAPAQVVEVTEQLDANLDWTTFQLGDFGFGGQTFDVPDGLTFYDTRIDATATVGVYVDVTADFDALTGQLTWTFTSIDPATGDLPADVLTGFLPPDTTDPEGDAFISYSVQPKANLTTNQTISAQADVIFDEGLSDQSSLETPTFVNTIDAGAPTSSVLPLPADSLPSFTVNWSGQDDLHGSGLASYQVYVSADGGPFTLWQPATTATSATYAGQVGQTYRFYSVATDNVGNVQPTPTTQAQTATPLYQIPASQNENAAPATMLVSTLLSGHYGGNSAKPGIAVTGLSGNGVWQYSANAKNWTAIANVSQAQALLLPGSDSLRFVAATNGSGQANLLFLAWDGSTGKAGSTANVAVNGGTTPFSAGAGMLALTVNPVPIWVGVSASLTSILPGNYDTTNLANPPGNTVLAVFGNDFQDNNAAVTAGVAIVGVTGSAHGTWQYLLNGATTWAAIPAVSTTAALLLSANDEIRFVPKNKYVGTASLTALAWDGSGGAPGMTPNPSKPASSAFSTKTLTATVTVNTGVDGERGGARAAPPLAKNATSPAITVSSLLTTTQADYIDADGATLPRGIAVTGAFSSVGALQYMLAGGAWQALPAVSSSAALLLPSAAMLRLVNNGQFGTAELTFEGWDQTQGTAGLRFDITSTGGASAFSAATSNLLIAVQQAPSWSAATGASLTTLASGFYNITSTTNPAGNSIESVFGNYFRDASPSVFWKPASPCRPDRQQQRRLAILDQFRLVVVELRADAVE